MTQAWNHWVELFAGLGLPLSKHTLATVAAIALFYAIGVMLRSMR